MRGRVFMVQGTASDVGKSLTVAALCRIYARRGLRVAPFKSQNMALNSAITPSGHEIGRAQAVQAEAAGTEPTVHMNPILLKPESETGCQVVLMGEVDGSMTAAGYHARKPKLAGIIEESLNVLRAKHDLVIIEGAGSPVEMNLKANDVANMFVAELCDAPVLLVADIDRGGVFASLIGTMALLEGSERERVSGFVINKFRGDPALLGNGLDILRERTGVPVLGVVPYLSNLGIADEDSVALGRRPTRFGTKAEATHRVAVVHLPHISNYDDVLPLEREPALDVAFVRDAESILSADLVILPGTKSTMADLRWLRDSGLASAVLARHGAGRPILGICGGCQMLGAAIVDAGGVESSTPEAAGLGILPFRTEYAPVKTTRQVEAIANASPLWREGLRVHGYELHMGQLHPAPDARAAFTLEGHGLEGHGVDGAVAASGATVGTMLHGIFARGELRKNLMSSFGAHSDGGAAADKAYDRLADAVQTALDMNALDRILGLATETAP